MLGMSEPSSHSSSQGESLKHYAVLFVQHRKIGTAVKDSVKQSRKPVHIYNFVCVSRCAGGLFFLIFFFYKIVNICVTIPVLFPLHSGRHFVQRRVR